MSTYNERHALRVPDARRDRAGSYPSERARVMFGPCGPAFAQQYEPGAQHSPTQHTSTTSRASGSGCEKPPTWSVLYAPGSGKPRIIEHVCDEHGAQVSTVVAFSLVPYRARR